MKDMYIRIAKVNGIKVLAVLVVFSPSLSSYAAPPPSIYADIRGSIEFLLKEPPKPPLLTINAFPIQQAQANSGFTYNIRPYIEESSIDISYLVMNNYWLEHSRSGHGFLRIQRFQLASLPQGITQSFGQLEDCTPLRDFEQGQFCSVRLHVDSQQVNLANTTASLGFSVYYHYKWKHGIFSKIEVYGDVFKYASSADQLFNILPSVVLPIRTEVIPATQDGLSYDPNTFTFSGKPTRTGVYKFIVQATNGFSKAEPRQLEIDVDINPKDKPVFKIAPPIPSVMLGREYQLNLLDLLEPIKEFMVSNQVHFEIDPSSEYPSWLTIDKENMTLLKGRATLEDAGKTKSVTIFAISNTGGKSQPFTLQIPVIADTTQKPVIEEGINLKARVGEAFHFDFKSKISDPSGDGTLKLHLDKIEPKAPWLNLSPNNSTELTGIVDKGAMGQTYQITVHASTQTGGYSVSKTIPLSIDIDKNKTPHFYAANPQLPLIYPGQPFTHDFVATRDVYPEYEEIPYLIEFAKGYSRPNWLRIENNKLIADKVPENIEGVFQVFITIKNIPGGISEPLALNLMAMN